MGDAFELGVFEGLGDLLGALGPATASKVGGNLSGGDQVAGKAPPGERSRRTERGAWPAA